MNMSCVSCDTAFEASQAALDCPSCGSAVAVALPPRRTALIACHSGSTRNLIFSALRTLGFDLVIHSSGRGLLEELRTLRPELAVLNVMLEGELGVTVCERARETSDLDSTRLVLIGAVHRSDRFRAKPTSTYGADAYLEEPFSAEEIGRIVRELDGRS